ncbi:tryptophan-rich sensory protein [Photobacterium leiognathi]|uniref:Uncharacterized protein n=1 Tax=Photobacterium leiognathi TaxID=553611 RepID=A0A2T3MHK4_PHOLE|nr:tryptophan-rich sensory protein [Photobacterium leiognathi]KJF99481.1 hypothetical protein UB34_01955 [Photobacterium leiognathi]PSV93852.1 hypothetical protein CTM89_01000 [Photobacterium leiognathi]
MTPEQNLLIMKWQFAATILMGLDYFISDSFREKANAYVRGYFQGMQERVDADVKQAFSEFKGKLFHVLISIIQIAIGVGLCVLSRHIDENLIWLFIGILLVALFFIIAGVNFAFTTVFHLLTKLGIAAPFRFLTTFLVGSPKGPIAAIGFICLMISFYLRYSYNGI